MSQEGGRATRTQMLKKTRSGASSFWLTLSNIQNRLCHSASQIPWHIEVMHWKTLLSTSSAVTCDSRRPGASGVLSQKPVVHISSQLWFVQWFHVGGLKSAMVEVLHHETCKCYKSGECSPQIWLLIMPGFGMGLNLTIMEPKNEAS